MKTSEQINEVSRSLISMQRSLETAKNDKTNPFFKSKYTSLTGVFSAVREPLSSNGLAVVQNVETLPEGMSVSTRLLHESGQWLEFGPLVMPVGKKDAHSCGSAISYAKRYALVAALGVVCDEEDDDGNQAQTSSDIKKQNNIPKPKVDALKWFVGMQNRFNPEDLDEYVFELSEATKKSRSDLIEILSVNEVSFIQKFNMWKQNKRTPANAIG